jgi:hypothetical protein
MTRNKKIIISIIAIIILSNVSPFVWMFKNFVDERHYRYSNYNGSFTFYEFMSRDFEMMKRSHKGCLSYRPSLKDKNVYRLFTKNPFAFWRWRLYFFDERYKLPYKSWEEIKKRREMEDIKDITGCTMEF